MSIRSAWGEIEMRSTGVAIFGHFGIVGRSPKRARGSNSRSVRCLNHAKQSSREGLVENQTSVSPTPLSRHKRWPEPSGASTKRVRAMRIRRGIGPAGRAERTRLRRKRARENYKKNHPGRRKELAAARERAVIEATKRSFKTWFAAPLSDYNALAFIRKSVIPDLKQAAIPYLRQIDAECEAAGLNRNQHNLRPGGIQKAIAERRRAYDFHCTGYRGAAAVRQTFAIPSPGGQVSNMEHMFLDEALRIFGNGDSFRVEFDA